MIEAVALKDDRSAPPLLELPEAVDDVLDVAAADEIGLTDEELAIPHEVEVGINEARGDDAGGGMSKVEVLCGRATQGERSGIIADEFDQTATHGQGAGDGAGGIKREDVRAGDEQIGVHGWVQGYRKARRWWGSD